MNYQTVYEAFIANRRGIETSVVSDFETHHILPRSLGGPDSPENLIRLSYSDHIFAHRLLAKIHGGYMWSAFILMVNTRAYCGRVTRSAYANAKRELREHLAIVRRTDEFRAATSATAKRVWADETYRKAMSIINSKKMLVQWKDPEYRAKMSFIRKGATKPEKFSVSMREVWKRDGYKDRFVGKVKATWTEDKRDETSLKSTEKWTDPSYRELVTTKVKAAYANPEVRAKLSAAVKGISWANNGAIQIRVFADQGVPEGFVLGRLPNQNGATIRKAAADRFGVTYMTVTKAQIAEFRELQCK